MKTNDTKLTLKPYYFLRHGQTDWNLIQKAQGQIDIPLNETGIQQAQNAQLLFHGIQISAICHNPLSRAKQTAEIVNQQLNKKLIPIDNLKECHLGVYEGKLHGPWLKEWREGKITENIERFDEFTERVLIGLNESLAHGENILIVAHGAVYWALQKLMETEEFGLDNCVAVYHKPIAEKFWKVEQFKNHDYC